MTTSRRLIHETVNQYHKTCGIGAVSGTANNTAWISTASKRVNDLEEREIWSFPESY